MFYSILGFRKWMAYRVGETYGLQGEDAEKALEVIEMRKANNILGKITNSHPRA